MNIQIIAGRFLVENGVASVSVIRMNNNGRCVNIIVSAVVNYREVNMFDAGIGTNIRISRVRSARWLACIKGIDSRFRV